MPAKAGIHSNQLMDSRALGAPGGNDSINNLLYSVLSNTEGRVCSGSFYTTGHVGAGHSNYKYWVPVFMIQVRWM